MIQTKKIIIYGLLGCHACKEACEFFDELNAEYEYKLVGDDIDPISFWTKTKSKTVPVIYIDDNKIIGFDRDEIKKWLV